MLYWLYWLLNVSWKYMKKNCKKVKKVDANSKRMAIEVLNKNNKKHFICDLSAA